MTELLREAIDKVVTDQNIDNTDELVKEWMDDKVYRLQAIRDLYRASPTMLGLGEFDEVKGEYPEVIETCAWMTKADMEVHIYQGLDRLARAIGAEIQQRVAGPDGHKNHYFNYKGVEFFEITQPGEALR